MLNKAVLEKFNGYSHLDLRWYSGNFLELAREGVYAAYADGFSYNGFAFLLIGFGGKTSTTGRFVRWNNRHAQRLSRDTAVLQVANGSVYVYKTPGYTTLADLDPVMNGESPYELKAIFHLESAVTPIGRINLETSLQQMFSRPLTPAAEVDPQVVRLSLDAFCSVPILALPYVEDGVKRYHMLKKYVEELMRQKE